MPKRISADGKIRCSRCTHKAGESVYLHPSSFGRSNGKYFGWCRQCKSEYAREKYIHKGRRPGRPRKLLTRITANVENCKQPGIAYTGTLSNEAMNVQNALFKLWPK